MLKKIFDEFLVFCHLSQMNCVWSSESGQPLAVQCYVETTLIGGRFISIARPRKLLLEVKLLYDVSCLSVGWSVCHITSFTSHVPIGALVY